MHGITVLSPTPRNLQPKSLCCWRISRSVASISGAVSLPPSPCQSEHFPQPDWDSCILPRHNIFCTGSILYQAAGDNSGIRHAGVHRYLLALMANIMHHTHGSRRKHEVVIVWEVPSNIHEESLSRWPGILSVNIQSSSLSVNAYIYSSGPH